MIREVLIGGYNKVIMYGEKIFTTFDSLPVLVSRFGFSKAHNEIHSFATVNFQI